MSTPAVILDMKPEESTTKKSSQRSASSSSAESTENNKKSLNSHTFSSRSRTKSRSRSRSRHRSTRSRSESADRLKSRSRDRSRCVSSKRRSNRPSGERERKHSKSSAVSQHKSERAIRNDRKKRRKRKKEERTRTSSTVVEICRLTSSVTREHVLEIFSQYGHILSLEIAQDLSSAGMGGPRAAAVATFQRASVEYENRSDAARARKYGNGGMIDRQEITVEVVSNRPSKKKHK